MTKTFTVEDGCWVVEVDAKITGGGVQFYVADSTRTNSHYSYVGVQGYTSNAQVLTSPYMGYDSVNRNDRTYFTNDTSYHHYRIVSDGDTTYCYRDNVLMRSRAGNNWLDGACCFGFVTWGGDGKVYVKNLKVKPYSV